MTTPKDEMFTTNEKEREAVRRRRRWNGCLGAVLITAALGVLVLWLALMGGCRTPDVEVRKMSRSRQAAIEKTVREMDAAAQGVVFYPRPAR